MIRNLKALGLALAAVFALSAAIASTASAEEPGVVTIENGPATLVGTELGAEGGAAENFFEAAGSQVKCPGSDLNGFKANVTPHELVPTGASEITITPIYTNCNVPVDMNGCDYDLKDATTTGGVAGTYGIKVKITCPTVGGVKQKIRVTAEPCNFLIPEQEVVGFHLTNDAGTPDDITLSGEASVSGTACGLPLNATQHQNVTVTGENAGGTAVGVTMSHN